jgi:hypothetical protein
VRGEGRKEGKRERRMGGREERGKGGMAGIAVPAHLRSS